MVNTSIQLQSYYIRFILYINLFVLLKVPWPFVLLTSYSETQILLWPLWDDVIKPAEQEREGRSTETRQLA